MIRLIEALNYRCLRYISQPMDAFHVLVGPNASGKTTYLDVIAFLGHLVSDGIDKAITDRTQNFEDLLWGRQGRYFELAIEAAIPDEKRLHFSNRYDTIRYEVRVGMLNNETFEYGILEERAILKNWIASSSPQRVLFPIEPIVPVTIFSKRKTGENTVLSKAEGGNDNYYSEIKSETGKGGWYPSIRLGPKKSTLANLPEDETRVPATLWLKQLLIQGVQTIILNSLAIKKASPPGKGRSFKPDGSNLPWVIEELFKSNEKRYRDWILHIQTALPEIESIKTIERPEDKHRYLTICYQGGFEIPSWMASDGTLRLLALTIPAYLSDFSGVYLIEEPENGIHPGAVETVFQSLSSVYDAQILLATHSPVIISMSDVNSVLCFKRTESGATDIVIGTNHPGLRDWKGQPNLSTLFASGVLG